MTPDPDPPRATSDADAHPATHRYRTRIRIFHAVVTTLATIGGMVMGFIVTLAIVVAKAGAGYYIFAMEDLAAARWELLPILLGGIAGFRIGRKRPHSVSWATVCGFGGLLLGIVIGALAGPIFRPDSAGRWAGAVVAGAIGLVAGSVAALRIRRVPRHPLIAGAASSIVFLGVVAFALFGATNLIRVDPFELEQTPGVPVPEPAAVDAVVFLLGDAGAVKKGRSPLLDAMQADVERWSGALARDSAVSIAYLGDLVYPDGIRNRDHPGFAQDSAHLWDQIELVGGESARKHSTVGLFITGNHDWGNYTGDEGLDRVANLGEQLSNARRAGHTVSLLPPAGEPGPSVRDLRRNVRIAFFDTHWFLQERQASQRRQFFDRLKVALDGARDREVILVSHHPYFSAGPHGAIVPGYHTGGLAYLLKKAGALVQDLNSPAYMDLLAGLRRTFEASRKPPLIYAGGHDHSLQVLTGAGDFDPRFALVSGSGSKVSSIRMGPGLAWGGSQPGYMMLVFRKDDAVDLFVIAGDKQLVQCPGDGDALAQCMTEGVNKFEIVYSASLLGPSREPRDLAVARPDTVAPGTPWWTDEQPVVVVDSADRAMVAAPMAVPARVLLHGTDSVTTTPGRAYPAGRLRRLLAGDLNRHLWEVPVRLPVLDLSKVAGGLHPTELSGGKQTVGLRFAGRDGLEYEFRPVVKYALMLPAWMRDGFVADVLEDQMAGQLPFGALVVSKLQDALGIVAPEPVAVVMPNDPRLGQYRTLFAGRVGLLAVHANERRGDRPGFGGYSRIVGSDAVFDSAKVDPASRFDGEAFVRIRLLDFLVGDWDRHSGQWRWGRRIADGLTTWRPIPEDRDWAFGRIDGLTSVLARLLLPGYVGFSSEFPSLRRLAHSGRNIDRRVLNELDRDAFATAAREIQRTLSDSVIESAIALLPASYVALERERLVGGLKSRRAALAEYAEQYYRRLARTVEVHGVAGAADVAEFTRLTENRVRLRVRSGESKRARFERVFDARDTREIRLRFGESADQLIGDDELPLDVEMVEEEPE